MPARYEFITVGRGTPYDDGSQCVIDDVISAGLLEVTGTATASGSRPQAPTSGYGRVLARVTALSEDIAVAHGEDPTATQSNSLSILSGYFEYFEVEPGDKLSFITLTTTP